MVPARPMRGVADVLGPAVGGVEVVAGDPFFRRPLVAEAVGEVVALDRVADRDQSQGEHREAAGERAVGEATEPPQREQRRRDPHQQEGEGDAEEA